jgi:hypothetical protein
VALEDASLPCVPADAMLRAALILMLAFVYFPFEVTERQQFVAFRDAWAGARLVDPETQKK